MNIGQRIKEVREELGMQAAVLARRVGVAPNTIYRIEAGDRTPSVALLEKIARELRTEPAELMREPVPLVQAPETGQTTSAKEVTEGLPLALLEKEVLACTEDAMQLAEKLSNGFAEPGTPKHAAQIFELIQLVHEAGRRTTTYRILKEVGALSERAERTYQGLFRQAGTLLRLLSDDAEGRKVLEEVEELASLRELVGAI